jgi:integrase
MATKAKPVNLVELGKDHWRIRVFVGRGADGRPKWASKNVRGTLKEAKAAVAAFKTDLDRQDATSHPGSVADLLDRWLDDIGVTRSIYTMREHRRTVEKTLKPAIGAVGLDKLTPLHLDDLYRDLLGRGLSPASVRRVHSVLSAALNRGAKWGLLRANPALLASPPGPARSTAYAPAAADVQRLMEAAEEADPVLAAAIALGAVTGARRGELCALRWSDVDWDRRRVRIEQSLTVVQRSWRLGPTKTHQRRDIAIDEAAEAFLSQRRQHQEHYAKEVGVDMVADPFVLSRSADGSTPCLPDGITGGYSRVAIRLGIKSHFHELRHFAATAAIAGGMDVRTVAGRLGHADPSVTLRVYAHAMEQRDRELADLLGSAVFGATHGLRSPVGADDPINVPADAGGVSD